MLDPTTVAEFLKRLHRPGEIRRQPTENDLAGEFEVVDCFLQVRLGERALAELANIPPATLNYLDSVYQRNQFKRCLPLCGP